MNKSYVLFNPKLNGYLTTGALYGSTMVTPNPLLAHHYADEKQAGLRAKQIVDKKEVLTVCMVSNPKVDQLTDMTANPAKSGFVIEVEYKSSMSNRYEGGVYFRMFPYGFDDPERRYSREVYNTFNRGAQPKIWKTADGAKPTLHRLEERAAEEKSGCKYKFRIIPYTEQR